jgi:hypothetical protein
MKNTENNITRHGLAPSEVEDSHQYGVPLEKPEATLTQ